MKPNGKPLLINFWATWCDPCREEFPDLVKIDSEYRGKIDFITVSLDDLADIDTFVPKFLSEVKATMPAYLLKTDDETAAIKMVSSDWAGNLPMTVLFDANGKPAYQRNGKVRYPILVAEIEKVLASKPLGDEMYVTIDYVKIKDGRRDEALYFYENNWTLYRDEALKRGVIHSYQILESVPSTTAPFDIILITWYKNEEQHINSEKNFEPILKELRPNGPKLKNGLGIDEFRQSLYVFRGKARFGSIK
ncbi:MAG: TlpA family protein disulfide reductase [Pyrinomonadaceae bacterium]|nr:TlpA family protein disulfide reductase [Pyrinomonadaceae bacterium]